MRYCAVIVAIAVFLSGCSTAHYTKRLDTLWNQYESGQLTWEQYKGGRDKVLASQKRAQVFNDALGVATAAALIGLAAAAAAQGGGSSAVPSSTSFLPNDDVYVHGYLRNDGTYVRSHVRRAPDQYRWNNFGPSTDSAQLLNPVLRDWDGDGIPNFLDLDDDNDGILDDHDNTQYGQDDCRYVAIRQQVISELELPCRIVGCRVVCEDND